MVLLGNPQLWLERYGWNATNSLTSSTVSIFQLMVYICPKDLYLY